MEKSQFIQKIEKFVQSHSFPPKQSLLVVALSGGADSVALLLVLKELGYRLLAAHCNFHLRGEESNRDEAFVAGLCSRLNVSLKLKHFDVEAQCEAHHVSCEMACRDLRYGWFEQLRCEHGASAIAVGHHRDDNVETFFLNLMRGSGVRGLAGIKPVNGHVVRPLLCVSRSEIEAYLEQTGEGYITDSTNAQNDFTRNKWRNIVLPEIEQLFPDARNAIARTIEILQDENDFLQSAIERLRAEITTPSGNGVLIDRDTLLATTGCRTLLFRILNEYGINVTQCDEILRSLRDDNAVGRSWNSATHEVSIVRNGIEVRPRREQDVHQEWNFTINDDLSMLPLPLVKSIIEPGTQFQFARDNRTVYFCKEIEEKTLMLRRWRNGDRIKPFGMKGSRLLSDIFSDLHFTPQQKENVWVLECEGEVLWIPGVRASRHYPCVPNKAIIALSLIE